MDLESSTGGLKSKSLHCDFREDQFSELWFPFQSSEDGNTYIPGFLRGVSEIAYVKHMGQCLALCGCPYMETVPPLKPAGQLQRERATW